MHNLLESCMLGLLVSAFLSLMVQHCKSAMGNGGRQVRNRDGAGICLLFLLRICANYLSALTTPPARAS